MASIDINENQSDFDNKARPAIFVELLAQVPEALSDEERAHYEGLISVKRARRDGAEVESATVLKELLGVIRPAFSLIVEGKVPGCGPKRLRYTLEMALVLSQNVSVFGESSIDAALARSTRSSGVSDAVTFRRLGIRALGRLMSDRPEDRERIRSASSVKKRRIEDRAEMLEHLAAQLEKAAAGVPESAAKEAGATPELIASLRAQAQNLMSVGEGSSAARNTIASHYDVMNELDGRLMLEIRNIVRALEDARATDRSIPAVRTRLLARRGKRKANTPKPAAVGPVAVPASRAPVWATIKVV